MTASTVVADASSEIERLLATPAAVLDAIPAAVSIVDRAGRWVRCNRRAADLAGVAPGADAIGGLAGFVRAFHPDGRPLPADEAPLAEVLATGVPVRDREVELERADGSRRIVLANVDPVRDPQGRLVGAVQCFHDITERASAERALRRSQQDLEDFFDNGAVGLHLVAADGTVLKANRAELDMLGYAPEEYIGQPISRFHADEPVIGDILQRLSCGEHLDRYPARLRARDGSIRHVLITSNVHFRDGEFLNTRCFTVDVTDWHQAEMERQAMERRLRSTLDMAPVGVAETDAEGRYLRVNPAMEAITGYTAGELLGLRFSDITHPDDRAREEAQYFGQLASGGANG
ncbi:MAG: PAS domain S-box protein, partial [Lysobacteraceae bacterium]